MAVDAQHLAVTATARTATWSQRMPRVIAGAALVAIVLLLPLRGDTYAHVAAYACIFIMVGLSMNVLTGYTGQISLGHQAFVGLGALTAANVVSTGVTPADPFMFGIGMLCAA